MTGRGGDAGAGRHGRAWGALFVVAASILWGTTGTAATFAPAVSPLAIGAAAMGVGGLLQALYAGQAIGAQRFRIGAGWRLVALGAVAVAVYPLAFYSSMRLSGVAVGTVVSIGSAPVAAALIERFADRKPFTRRWIAGALLGISGAALLSFYGHGPAGVPPASGDPSSQWSTTAGIALGLLAGGTYALYSWAAHGLIGGGISSRAAMGAVFGLGGLMLMPVLALTGAPLLASWTNFSVGAYMAVVPMFAGYILFGWGLARTGASTATSISLLETVVAALLAVLVVGERLPAPAWLGAAVVLGSLFILTPGRGHATGHPPGPRGLPGSPTHSKPAQPSEPAQSGI